MNKSTVPRKLSSCHRVIRVKRTGQLLISFFFDVERRTHHAHEYVDLTTKDHVRAGGRVRFSEDQVEVTARGGEVLGDELLDAMLVQYSKRPDVAALLKTGTHVLATKRGTRSVTKNQNYGAPHSDAKCPHHGCSMHIKKAPNGGEFLGCPRFYDETCKVTASLENGAIKSWHIPSN